MSEIEVGSAYRELVPDVADYWPTAGTESAPAVPAAPTLRALLGSIEVTHPFEEASKAWTASSSGIVTAAAHGFQDGDRLVLLTVNHSTGLAAGVEYFVTNSTTDTFQLATCPGGEPTTCVGTTGHGDLARCLGLNVNRLDVYIATSSSGFTPTSTMFVGSIQVPVGSQAQVHSTGPTPTRLGLRIPVETGDTRYVKVKAVNAAGLESTAASAASSTAAVVGNFTLGAGASFYSAPNRDAPGRLEILGDNPDRIDFYPTSEAGYVPGSIGSTGTYAGATLAIDAVSPYRSTAGTRYKSTLTLSETAGSLLESRAMGSSYRSKVEVATTQVSLQTGLSTLLTKRVEAKRSTDLYFRGDTGNTVMQVRSSGQVDADRGDKTLVEIAPRGTLCAYGTHTTASTAWGISASAAMLTPFKDVDIDYSGQTVLVDVTVMGTVKGITQGEWWYLRPAVENTARGQIHYEEVIADAAASTHSAHSAHSAAGSHDHGGVTGTYLPSPTHSHSISSDGSHSAHGTHTAHPDHPAHGHAQNMAGTLTQRWVGEIIDKTSAAAGGAAKIRLGVYGRTQTSTAQLDRVTFAYTIWRL